MNTQQEEVKQENVVPVPNSEEKKKENELIKKLLEWGNNEFGLKSSEQTWLIEERPDKHSICHWTYKIDDKPMSGSFMLVKALKECRLSLAFGIGLQMHPLRDPISLLMQYINTVAYREKERNTVGELILRGYIWYELTRTVPRDVAMQQILHDWHIKDNIDEMYKAYANWKAKQNPEKKLVGKKH